MTEQLSSDEATKRWEALLSIQRKEPKKPGKRKREKPPTPEKDPFDCSSVKVLPTHEIVEKALHRYLNQWKELDNRKIQGETTATKLPPVEEDDTNSPVGCRARTNNGGGWRAMEDRLSLPEGFDYNTTKNEPPLDDGFSGDRVISLDNPTETLSYRAELWKLFDSIPTFRELEKEARKGHNVSNTLQVYKETHNPKGTSPNDIYLSRLRMPNRHGLPQSPISASHFDESRTRPLRETRVRNSHSSTLVFEFWRRQPKRGASSDCHRMVLEFLARQTLWDVHMVLTQMVEDDIWIAACKDKDTKDDGNRTIEDSNLPQGLKTKTSRSEQGNNDANEQNPSGCFFIENTFYNNGPVDYVKCITDWIDSNNNPLRRRYLGIDPSADIMNCKTMKHTKLGQVPFRLNVRYYHACHGDVETAVMLVDRKLNRQKEGKSGSGRVVYPLIHDIWTPSRLRLPAAPVCDACQTYQSVFQTSINCKTTDGGPRSLCHECCRELRLLENEQESVTLNRWWRDQASLSTTIAREHGAIF